jgi:hypothetical protein
MLDWVLVIAEIPEAQRENSLKVKSWEVWKLEGLEV